MNVNFDQRRHITTCHGTNDVTELTITLHRQLRAAKMKIKHRDINNVTQDGNRKG